MTRTRTRNLMVTTLLAGVVSAMSITAAPATAAPVVSDRTLRVYSNNMENLVLNSSTDSSDGDDLCDRISGPEHLTSMLVDDNGRTGTSGVVAPDLLILQQVRGQGQADAYADQLSAKFGYAAGTYKAIVVWQDPEPWGGSHLCATSALGDLKKKQTNGIVYNSARLSLTATAAYWSAGWLKPGAAYAGGAGCVLYKGSDADGAGANEYKWKRTSAIAAKFTVKATGTSVFAATMHLPEENRQNGCAGDGDAGINGTGIHLGASATSLLSSSTIRVVGMDANRTGIPASTLSGSGLQGYGTGATSGSSKIDYLFVRGSVHASPVGYTVAGTRSNHKALYSFIDF
ncbi:MAG: hypothetical protein ACRYG2_06415 [Janthinobacterium lividum]